MARILYAAFTYVQPGGGTLGLPGRGLGTLGTTNRNTKNYENNRPDNNR